MKSETVPSIFGAAALFAGFLAHYLLTGNQNFSYDSISYAHSCETGQWKSLFHPNHPLSSSLPYFRFKLERILGSHGYAIHSLERFNLFFSSLGLAILYFPLARAKKGAILRQVQ